MKNIKTRAALAGAAAALLLTGCTGPGWEGEATVTEIELLNAEREGNNIEHDGVDFTVETDRGIEKSVTVADCDPSAVVVKDRVTVADVEKRCDNPIGYSEDE